MQIIDIRRVPFFALQQKIVFDYATDSSDEV